MYERPFLTADRPGVGGRIKCSEEDFFVEEIPLYLPCGEGEHLYCVIEKTGLTTHQAIDRLARQAGVSPREVGSAGLKDSRARTVQTLSFPASAAGALADYGDERLRVLSTALHTNKLRTGHLAGNRFRIRIREVGPDAEARSRAVLEILSRRGVPNYYGGQRFGMREDNDRVGAALARGDTQEVFAILLGRPNDTDPPAETAARTAYDAGDLARAKGLWPGNRRDARRILDAVMRRGPSPAALKAIDRRMVRLYVSALQSRIFNEVLARRVDQIDRVQTGDLAQKTDSGGVFLVEVVAAEAPRAAAGEISPTGPLPGSRARLAEGEPGRVEREILAAFGLEEGGIPRVGPLKVKGTRRALRFLPESVASEAGSDEHGAYLEIRFAAPPGSYATVLLREIMKVDVP